MKNKYFKSLSVFIIVAILSIFESIVWADDRLSSLIMRVNNQSKPDVHISNLENHLLGRLSWQIKCHHKKLDDATACMMTKGKITVLRINNQYSVSVGDKVLKNSAASIEVDNSKIYSANDGLYRNANDLISEFQKGNEAIIKYKKQDKKNGEIKLPLIGFSAAFNDMEGQFKELSK